jgi:hypothetical protein
MSSLHIRYLYLLAFGDRTVQVDSDHEAWEDLNVEATADLVRFNPVVNGQIQHPAVQC